MYMKHAADAEDMTQNTFMRLMAGTAGFESSEHERAWLLRTAINLCKNSLKSWRSKTVEFDERYLPGYTIPEPDETLKKVMALSPKLKTALYLYYYEGYNSEKIAELMGKPASTIRGYLHRGRNAVKKEIETEEQYNEACF
jgi:RNA polymerase sigma-70 factor (ECF subfamily)